ncbi:MAG: Diacetylchitobiose deacetylase [Candidatus Thorarchaeota archaeon]|nr:MAG: Diacetylchitobiose deacetylase [Candidatus Thorarchaeota archaeon]
MTEESACVLVIIAHPDDESLGAGGTIRQHVINGIPVDVHCMTGNEERNEELKKACSVLGVRNLYLSEREDFDIDMSMVHEVVATILKSRPTIIITHSQEDYNRNHQICAQIVEQAVEWASHITIFDNAHRVERIYHMEINSLHPHPHVHVNITNSYSEALHALRQHKSQTSKANDFYEKLYDARTRLRGVQADVKRAEAFTISLPKHAGPFYPENSVETLV